MGRPLSPEAARTTASKEFAAGLAEAGSKNFAFSVQTPSRFLWHGGLSFIFD